MGNGRIMVVYDVALLNARPSDQGRRGTYEAPGEIRPAIDSAIEVVVGEGSDTRLARIVEIDGTSITAVELPDPA